MKNKFTSDEQVVVDFLKSRPHSTATEIAAFTGLKKRGVVTRLLEDLDKKGVPARAYFTKLQAAIAKYSK